ncbi:MAG: MSCRAMM family protein [Thermoanaerobaculia bacterium]
MRRTPAPWIALSIAFTALLGAGTAFGQFSGSFQVTDAAGNPAADNIFSTRDQVFFTAGPTDAACSIGALPDGVYAFQVTDASGTTVLSSDPVANRMFLVAGGVIADNAPGGTHVAAAPLTACGSHLVAVSPINLAPKQTGVYKLWVQSAGFCGASGCDFLPQNSDTFNFVVREKARCLATHCVSGLVFSDTNQSGVQDAGEPGLPGILVVARDSHGIANTAVTGPDGTFSICGLTETSYTISQVVPTGYQQTAPAGSRQISRYLRVGDFTYLLDICNASTTGLVFGDFPLPGSISGTKFNDANGNGLLDPGEAGVGGVTIQLLSAAGSSAILATTVTDGSGNFSFANLTPENYALGEVLPDGYRQTAPGGGGVVFVTVAPGQNVQDVLFGNQLIPQFGAISGMKFNDLNGNGVQDANEPGLAGVTIVLTAVTGAHVTTTTDAGGNFSFQNVTPGGYTLSEVVPAGYQQTAPPPPGTMTVTVTAGNTVSNVLFGNQLLPVTVPKGSITGFVYYDFNKNTVQDPTELGLPDVTMNLFDLSNHLVATTTTDANGLFTFSNVPAGDYTVSPVPPENFFQTVPPNKAPINVHIDAGQQVTGLIFGLTC